MQTAYQGPEGTCRPWLTWVVSAGTSIHAIPSHTPGLHLSSHLAPRPGLSSITYVFVLTHVFCSPGLWTCFYWMISKALLYPSFISCPASSHACRMDFESMLEPCLLLLLTGPWMLFITVPCLGVSMGPVAILTLLRSCERASCWWDSCCVGLLLGFQLIPALGALILLVPAAAVVERYSL